MSKVANRIKDTVLLNRFKRVHITPAKADKANRSNLIQLLIWWDEDSIVYRNKQFCLKENPHCVLYKDMMFNHYTGEALNVINTLMAYYELSFPQAYYVANHFRLKVNKPDMEEYIRDTYTSPLIRVEDPNVDLDYILEADLTQSASATIKAPALRRVYAYLHNTRRIDRDLVSHFLKKRYLAMDANFNLCFLTYRDGKVISITKKGTDPRHPFKQNIVREKHTGFWYGSSTVEEFREVYVFESCVDLLSFLTLAKRGKIPKLGIDACYISLNGASTFYLERVLSEHPTIQRIHLCLDNDEVGRRTSENFMRCHTTDCEVDTLVEQLNDCRFPGDMFKDWNERLQSDTELPF